MKRLANEHAFVYVAMLKVYVFLVCLLILNWLFD